MYKLAKKEIYKLKWKTREGKPQGNFPGAYNNARDKEKERDSLPN